MEKQPNNVGNFVLQHVDENVEHAANVSDEASDEFADTSVSPAPSVRTNSNLANSKLENLTQNQSNRKWEISNLAKSSKLLNYSHDDINALASKAEFLVLTGSNNDLTVDNSSDDDETAAAPKVVDGLDLESLETRYDEPCLSGTWEHDIQVGKFHHK